MGKITWHIRWEKRELNSNDVHIYSYHHEEGNECNTK